MVGVNILSSNIGDNAIEKPKDSFGGSDFLELRKAIRDLRENLRPDFICFQLLLLRSVRMHNRRHEPLMRRHYYSFSFLPWL